MMIAGFSVVGLVLAAIMFAAVCFWLYIMSKTRPKNVSNLVILICVLLAVLAACVSGGQWIVIALAALA